MLNRRYLRVKILQALYAWIQSGSEDYRQSATDHAYQRYENALAVTGHPAQHSP